MMGKKKRLDEIQLEVWEKTIEYYGICLLAYQIGI